MRILLTDSNQLHKENEEATRLKWNAYLIESQQYLLREKATVA
jgi:hypothetical protein